MHEKEIEIKFLRLNSGEDIITELQKLDDITYRLHNPLKIVYYFNENVGLMSISLVPWIFNRITENEHYDMEKHNIIVSSNISIAMTKSYYGLLNKIQNNIYDKEQQETDALVEDVDDEYEEEEELNDEELKKTKELLNDVIRKRYH